jgi:hypothetical protein
LYWGGVTTRCLQRRCRLDLARGGELSRLWALGWRRKGFRETILGIPPSLLYAKAWSQDSFPSRLQHRMVSKTLDCYGCKIPISFEFLLCTPSFGFMGCAISEPLWASYSPWTGFSLGQNQIGQG